MRAATLLQGAASAALRRPLELPRRPGRVLAAFRSGVYIEIRSDEEPYVVAVVTPEATRLPNAIVIGSAIPRVGVGDDSALGDGLVEIGDVGIRIRRWWDPSPALGPIPCLGPAVAAIERLLASSTRRCGLDGYLHAAELAAGCAENNLLKTVTAAEHLVGLGPGLTPSGDDMVAGLLVALRVLGRACQIGPAVRLADWLGATVTFDARTRTTPLSATLLHCAAQGQACNDATAVLQSLAGRGPLEPALRRLLAVGHTSGADMAWGLLMGARAVCAMGAP